MSSGEEPRDKVPPKPRPPREEGRPPGLEILDRRRPERIVIPFYIVAQYGGELGVNGLALYLGLSYHVGRQKVVWPSYNTLAREIGTSRSTIERTMPILRDLGLILVEPRIDSRGQKSNRITLVDPGALDDPPEDPPPVTQPAPSDRGRRRPHPDGAGAVNSTAPPSQNEGAPVEGYSKEELPEGSAPALHVCDEEIKRQALELTQLWMRQLAVGHPGQRAAHKKEIHAEVLELLRRDFDPEGLERSMLDEDRDRSEYPRIWRARQTCRKAAPRDYAAIAARHKDDFARGAQEAAAARKRLGGKVSMHDLQARYLRGEDLRAVLVGEAAKMPPEE